MINIPEYFFNPLTSKHRNYYVDIFLQIKRIITDSRQFAPSRSFVLDELRRYIEFGMTWEDISDEEDYDGERKNRTDNDLSDDLSYIIRKFTKSKWIEIEENGDYNSDLISITYTGNELLQFFDRLSGGNEQTGYVMSVLSSLSNVRAIPEYGYVNIKNAYDATLGLRSSLEKMYSKIKEYYNDQLSENSPEKILKSHFDGYLKDVIDKVIFPLKVDDSISRFRIPIIDKVKSIFEDSELQNNILLHAQKSKSSADMEQARAQLLSMLNYISREFENIGSLVNQLDEKNNTYVRITRQKLAYMLNMDTGIHGNIISVLRDSNDNQDKIYELMKQCIMIYDVEPITDDSFYKERKRRVYENEKPVEIEDVHISQEDINKTIEVYGAHFTKRKINEYAKKLLTGRGEIKSDELILTSDDDYVMSIVLASNSTDYTRSYDFELEDGTVKRGMYEIPRFTIKEKK